MDPFIGEIRIFAGPYAPEGWAFCDGSLLAAGANPALCSLLGKTYGGDGETTFALPDLRGRTPVHMGQGNGLSPRTRGESGGAETVTLQVEQLPAHNHTALADAVSGNQTGPYQATWAPSALAQFSSNPANATMNSASIGPTGANYAHANMPAYLAINFIIALKGLYPTQP